MDAVTACFILSRTAQGSPSSRISLSISGQQFAAHDWLRIDCSRLAALELLSQIDLGVGECRIARWGREIVRNRIGTQVDDDGCNIVASPVRIRGVNEHLALYLGMGAFLQSLANFLV